MKTTLAQFHADAMREYAACWVSPERRDELGVSHTEAAYHLIESASLLHRYTGDARCLKKVVELPHAEQARLLASACYYLSTLNIASKTEQLLTQEPFDDNHLAQIEDVIILRDGIECALDQIRQMASKVILQGDEELATRLERAISVVNEIDESLVSRPEVVSVASRALSGLKEHFQVAVNQKQYWWFGAAASLDEAFENTNPFEEPELAAATHEAGETSGVEVPELPSTQVAHGPPVTYMSPTPRMPSEQFGDWSIPTIPSDVDFTDTDEIRVATDVVVALGCEALPGMVVHCSLQFDGQAKFVFEDAGAQPGQIETVGFLRFNCEGERVAVTPITDGKATVAVPPGADTALILSTKYQLVGELIRWK